MEMEQFALKYSASELLASSYKFYSVVMVCLLNKEIAKFTVNYHTFRTGNSILKIVMSNVSKLFSLRVYTPFS